ncbi:hypothetical protein FOQG_12520 [Fusarium oxysporum f. sp. raphani 54005]|uniref:Uncharacterized protein n=2 Tax=Fusarium oxysporum f. sp. raphani TaxID=96318 RepID=X0BXH0_FUSOX|nr:hypothetical protein FOQG_12520 [Fusarium oxysporum f. sp. raphani 54005]KAG7425849.1 hypothetical protein Forpi1262_v013491 [Fusarium oxysporum f. sp. raphani]WKT50954.1 hypothetical protein QSH57_015924 [Fusarium oxysporum f. sp. vasinfectum]
MATAMASIPSGWEQIAMVLPQLLSFSPIIQQMALVQNGSNEEQIQVNKLQAQLNAAKDEIDRVGSELEPLVVQCGNDTLDKLELAMNKVYKLAVFVRGLYDDREPDVEQRDSLLKQMIDAFQTMEDVAEAGLKAIGDRHGIISELQNTKIIPAKKEIELLVQQTRNELASINDKIRTSQAGVATFEQTVRDQNDAVSSLRDKIEETENAKIASDIGFTILTFGIGNLINDGPLDPAGLGNQLNEAHRLLDDANHQLREAQSSLSKMQIERNQLDSRLRFVQQTEQLVPQLTSAAEAAEFRSIALQRRFAPLKEGASKLLMRVREIQQGAVVTQAIAYSKKDFAEGLLRICNEALMDQALEDETRLVRDEVVNEYGEKLPSDVDELAAEVTEKINTFSSLPSLRQGSALTAA